MHDENSTPSLEPLLKYAQRINCAKGDELIHHSDNNLYFYRLISGDASVRLVRQQHLIQVMNVNAGDWIGLRPMEVQERYGFSLICNGECEFDRIPWSEIEESIQTAIADAQLATFSHRLHVVGLLINTFLRNYPNVSADFLKDLIKSARFTRLEENQTLFGHGDKGQVMYFLLSGKIDVYVGEGQLKRVGEIFHGEPFGEMSLFSNESRNATLVATRSSDIVSLDRRHFDRLSIKYPWLSTYIVSSLIDRIKKQKERGKREIKPVNRLLLQIGGGETHKLGKRLKDMLVLRDVRLVSREEIRQHFGDKPLEQLVHTKLVDYLENAEQLNPTNIFYAQIDDLEWTKFCLERADEVWMLVNTQELPVSTKKQLAPLLPMYSWQKQKKFLILHHPGSIAQSARWLDSIACERHFHTNGEQGSMERLTRYLTDKSFGLVLGGGGARGFAQVGVLKALEEAGLKVDWVGGTSMGSIIGGWIAMGWDSTRISEAVKRFFVSVNPLGDYTLPMISLSKSQRLDMLLQQGFGEVLIEDLPLPYFCVSSDMSIAKEKDHERGILWKAVRASVSIPGVVAPAIEDGHYLVDGGLFNNLPCDLMRQRNNGPIAAIDVSPDDTYLTQLESVPSPWLVILNKLMGRPQPKVPTILDTLLRSSLLASKDRQRANREIVDYFLQPSIQNVGMLDFKHAERIMAMGYQEGLRLLEQGQISQIPQ
ncbi:patatin-like phospholipase family protein [Aliiglaciecola sp. CAU 1673]|uniref:patatin-like phospholipase family protein n=1 Tax=Aliiglaciecola sp. CAU 1673 TaxID=3032595 RepID=UPI0023DBCAA3|nr:patatin-like phospholipase family protein [Aliiglaciecola sp. CAU 1673]MDF2177704.1 patatin-like phospholipase family protein [Aliiglaciecola sp. CAU 1673]